MPQSLDQPPLWAPPQQAARVASSNQTLNAFLGGRPHSWMTDAAHPTPNLQRPLDNATRKRARQPNDLMMDGNGSRRESLPMNPLSSQSVTIEPSRNQAVLPSPALTDEPSPVVSNQVDSPNRGGNGFPDTTGLQQNIATGKYSGGALVPTLNPQDPRGPVVESPRTTHNAIAPVRPNTRTQVMTPAPGIPVPIQPAPAASPPLLPGSTISSLYVNYGTNADSSNSGTDPKRRRLQRYDEPGDRTNQLLQLIKTHMSQSVNESSANSADIPRYRVLRNACEARDVHYIALHQAFCYWSLDKPTVHSALGPYLSPQIVDHGLNIMESFLRPNALISHTHLRWFAGFPTQALEICEPPQQNPFAIWIARLLWNLTHLWEQMVSAVRTRRYPLLAYEIIANLNCHSPTLQPIIFTMSYRVLGVNDASWGNIFNETFVKDQQSEARISGTQHTTEALHSMRTGFADFYQRVMNQMQPQQANQSPVPSPTMHDFSSAAQQGPRHSLGHASPIPPHLAHPSQQAQVPRRRVTGPAALGGGSTQGSRIHTPMVSSPTVVQSPQPSPGLPLEHMQPVSQGLPGAMPPHQRTSLPHPVPQPQRLASNAPSANTQGMPRPLYRQSSQSTLPSQSGSISVPHSPGLQYPPHMSQSPSPLVSPQFQATPTQQLHNWAQHFQAAPNGHGNQVIHAPPQYQPQRGTPVGIAPTAPAAPPRPVVRQHGLQTPMVEIPMHDRPMSPYGLASLPIGLHMVGSRSPRRAPAETVEVRFYQYTKQLVIGPVECMPQMTLQTLSFNVPEAYIQKLARKNTSTGLPFCYYFEGACRYRLRMCAKSEREKELEINDWVVSACSWPQHIFVSLNGATMGLRRKQHFQKDLPLELTDGLITGLNTVTISFPAVPHNFKRGQKYFVAIELVETNSHDFIKSMVEKTQRIGAEETKGRIQKRLRPADSDDLIIQDDGLRVSLADPFTFNMFEIPARGMNCQHLECFDLEIWLQTRPKKPTQKGGGPFVKGTEPSMVDDWRCPICDGDARPLSLRIDEYFVQIRSELLAGGETNVKAVTVAVDGGWTAVEEPDDTEEDTPVPTRANTTNRDIGMSKSVSAADVIEILDD